MTANTPVSQNAVSYVGTNHVCLTDLHSAGCSVMLHVLDNYFQSQMKTVLHYLSSVFRGSYEEFNHFHLKAFYSSTLLRAETCPLRFKPSRQVTEDRARGVGSMNRPRFCSGRHTRALCLRTKRQVTHPEKSGPRRPLGRLNLALTSEKRMCTGTHLPFLKSYS